MKRWRQAQAASGRIGPGDLPPRALFGSGDDADEDDAVRGDRGGELVGEGAKVFLAPEVADELGTGEAEVGPLDGEGVGVGAAVEETDGEGAVIEGFGVDGVGYIVAGDAGGYEAKAVVRLCRHGR